MSLLVKSKSRRRTFTQNPGWLAKALTGNLQSMMAQVDRPYLPKLVEAATSGKKTLVEWKEYGCGAYGCVLPTYDDLVVLKVTTDPTEAAFVKRGMPWGWPAGITAYFGIMELDGSYKLAPKHEGKAWAIWRESATDVGSLDILEPLPEIGETKASYKERKRVDPLFGVIRQAGDRVHTVVWSASADPVSLAELWRTAYLRREEAGWLFPDDADVKRWEDLMAKGEDDVDGGFDLAIHLEAYRRAFRAMQKSPVTSAVGLTLEYYFDHQLVMGDLHTGNYGIVQRDKPTWAITDPGHIVDLPSPWA